MISANDIVHKIDNIDLDDCSPELVASLNDWKLEAAELEEIAKLKDHFAIKRLLDRFNARLVEIDTRLLAERGLSQDERLNLLDRKEIYCEIIDFFNNTDERLKSIEDNIAHL